MGLGDFAGGLISKGDKFLGGVTNGLIGPKSTNYFRDGRRANYDLGQKGSYFLDNLPRQKFNYFVKIDFNRQTKEAGGESFVDMFLSNAEQQMLMPISKSVDLPSASIDTDRLNQYNHWKLSQTKINYNPIDITFHDTVDGKSLRFWEMYFEYYFKDGIDLSNTSGNDGYHKKLWSFSPQELIGSAGGNDQISDTFSQDFGYNLETVQNERDLIKSISIFMVHAGRFSKVVLVNPKVSAFRHDSLGYDGSDLVELSLSLEYEYFLYDNHNRDITEDDLLTVYANSNHQELENFKPVKPEFKHRQRGGYAQIDELAKGKEFTKDTSVLGNLQGDLRGILEGGPSAISSAVSSGIMTGEFDFPIDPAAIKDQLVSNVKGQSLAVVARGFGAVVGDVTSSFTDVVRDAIPNPDEAPGSPSEEP